MNEQTLKNESSQITGKMIMNSKTIECECGGKIFSEKLMFKKLSALTSPNGKEEMFPINLVVCEKCGKVPSVFNPGNVIPEELIAKKKK